MLLRAVRAFVAAASRCAGVHRISLVGSLATDKPIPKDADVVVIDRDIDLAEIARLGRRLKGQAQYINLGADIFLADPDARYLGRICGYRECRPRVLCRARHCGARQHLDDDLDAVTLSTSSIEAPPLDLWPSVVRRVTLPDDVETVLLGP